MLMLLMMILLLMMMVMMVIVAMLLLLLMMMMMNVSSQTMRLKIFNPKVRTNCCVQPQSSVRYCITWGIRPNYVVENFQPQSPYEFWGST